MPSQARKAFDENCRDIDRLLEIHAELTGTEPGRRYGVDVLHRTAIVLICAYWESYCEDLAAEALSHLVKHTKSPSDLPVELQRIVARELKGAQHELAVWKLAGDGWRSLLQNRLSDLQEERNKKLNTPKTAQIDELFKRAVGIDRVSSRWFWPNMPADRAREKLDRYVSLRGEVAHRGRGAASIRKSHVVDFQAHVKVLVGKTGGNVNSVMRKTTGTPLWRQVRRRRQTGTERHSGEAHGP
jgi:hypothetical protein